MNGILVPELQTKRSDEPMKNIPPNVATMNTAKDYTEIFASEEYVELDMRSDEFSKDLIESDNNKPSNHMP